MRAVLLFFLAAALIFADTFKLYLKDGGFHLVREYQVEGDRVRYYSTERSDWEEIPTALVDLDKTEQQRKARTQERARAAREQDEEEQAERELRREIQSIPVEGGAYFKVDGQIKALKQADYEVITNKKRRALQVLSPVPLIPGKASVVIKGEHSAFLVHGERPEFYLRLVKEERFGIIKLSPKKNLRIVEGIALMPVTNQALEERNQIETFEQQLAGDLFKVWPEKPLESGEYALMQYPETEDREDLQLLIWDFALDSGSNK